MPTGKKYSSKANEDKIKKAVKDGKLTKKQVDGLSEGLLLGIIKKGDKKGGIKETRKKMGKQAHKAGRPKKGSMVKIGEK
tara:strand:- start:580 stop:819 length:240 start_codon:yes stop_codon:yes gene_type:complete